MASFTLKIRAGKEGGSPPSYSLIRGMRMNIVKATFVIFTAVISHVQEKKWIRGMCAKYVVFKRLCAKFISLKFAHIPVMHTQLIIEFVSGRDVCKIFCTPVLKFAHSFASSNVITILSLRCRQDTTKSDQISVQKTFAVNWNGNATFIFCRWG